MHGEIIQAAGKEGCCLAAVSLRMVPEVNDKCKRKMLDKALYNLQLYGVLLLAR